MGGAHVQSLTPTPGPLEEGGGGLGPTITSFFGPPRSIKTVRTRGNALGPGEGVQRGNAPPPMVVSNSNTFLGGGGYDLD